MADPVDPGTPSSPEPPLGNSGGSTTGLPSNVAAALACFPLIGGLIFWFLEKRDSFVRFYAMQSIIFGAAWLLFNIASGILHAILWSLPAVGGLFGTLWTFVAAFIHLALFIIMVIAMIKAFSGSRWDIPYVGPIARRQVGEP
jgi:Predicted membrane protein